MSSIHLKFFSTMRVIFALLFLALSSCTSHQSSTSSINSNLSSFLIFCKKFKPLHLPYSYRLTDLDSDKISGLKELDFNSNDTLFIKSKDMGKAFCYGLLTDTSHFYALIFLFPGDSYYPVMMTYSKNGELLSEENLIANGCSPDCGLKRYSINCKINKDFTINSSDTSIWEYRCDSLGQPIINTAFTWIDTKVGKVDSGGKIQLSHTTRQEIKN